MKKFVIFLTALFISAGTVYGQQDAITRYFDKYVDDERFDVVYVSPKMFEMVSKVEINEMDDDLQEIIRELKGFRVLHTDQNAGEFYREARSKINLDEYEMLVSARDGSENIKIMVRDDGGDIVKELFMLIGGENNFVMMSFVGNIDLKKVGKLAKVLDIDGVRHLEKLDKEKK